MMIHILRTVVGWIVIFIFVSASTGDPGNFIALFLFSIICTAGVGLLIWIPFGYGIGSIVVGIVFAIVETTNFYMGLEVDKRTRIKPAGTHQVEPAKSKVQSLTERLNQELHNDSALTRNQSALFNYIKKAKEKGLTNEQISLNLQNNGWPAGNIIWALNALG